MITPETASTLLYRKEKIILCNYKLITTFFKVNYYFKGNNEIFKCINYFNIIMKERKFNFITLN